MTVALFGIENDGVNLAVNLLVFFLVVIWLALVYWTYSDASRRIDDPMLVGCATAGALFPFIGTIVYAIVRPPEYLEDARERELEIKAAEGRVRMIESRTCRNCGAPIEPSYLACPSCMRKLRDPCGNCGKPLDPRWRLCPYCETETPEAQVAAPRSRPERRGRPSAAGTDVGAPDGASARGDRPLRPPERLSERPRRAP